MAGKPTRGLFQIIYKHFVDSFKPRRLTGDLIGKDYLGNKYYETPRRADSERTKPARYFEPAERDNFEQEMPAEWEAWLRYRRREPPSESEVLKNLAMIQTKKKNAAELDRVVEASRPPITEATQVSGLKFPVYEEYKEAGAERPNNRKD